jgi:hypothetical protein
LRIEFAEIEVGWDATEAFSFALESFVDSLLLFQCQKSITQLECADLEAADSGQARQPTL